ncbi:RNA polymerase III subunit C82 [Marasmius crinis-equi]|uniref:DNA-directed RNA polymerase III subunit RPC3 n=1 Tax=Marasmius crinis-equi TaxID=585013 RepID=A0ABR3F375_9AGAR
MADAPTRRLCAQIISTHFGPLTAKIAETLLTRGRLTFPTLVRFSQLKPRTVRTSILVLVQHNCLWHATEDTDEVLEFNIEECLSRLSFGFYAYQAQTLFGDAASEIVQLILDHGKLRPPDIMSYSVYGERKGNAVYAQALHTLVSKHYLKPSTILSHISPRDKRIQYEADERAKLTGLPTSKQLREAKEAAYARLKREEEEAEKVGLKRKALDVVPKSKKRKTASSSTDTGDDTVVDLIERAARERFNDGAALVIRAALDLTLPNQMSLNDVRSDPISVSNIIVHLNSIDDEDTLISGLVHSSSKTPSASACIKEYIGMLASAENPTPSGRESAFLTFTSGGSSSHNNKIQVDFEILARRLRRRLLEDITLEKHGPPGLRIVRLLLSLPTAQGKLDEKQIAKTVMMAAKDVRPLLSALTTDGLVCTVEVPKSADRNPTRMFYLWYVDVEKALMGILNGLYKTLYNISARRQAEREDPMLVAVLEKRERTDVKMDEGLLSPMERDMIRSWEEKEERLGVLEERIQDSTTTIVHRGLNAHHSNSLLVLIAMASTSEGNSLGLEFNNLSIKDESAPAAEKQETSTSTEPETAQEAQSPTGEAAAKEKEIKKKPYVNPDRFKTGGSQRDKLTEEELSERMERIRQQNEKIKQRRLDVQADEDAFRKTQEEDKAKQVKNRKVQEGVDKAREQNAKRKMDKVQSREWDSGKPSSGDWKGKGPGPGTEGGADNLNEVPQSPQRESGGWTRGSRGGRGRGGGGRGGGRGTGRKRDSDAAKPDATPEQAPQTSEAAAGTDTKD